MPSQWAPAPRSADRPCGPEQDQRGPPDRRALLPTRRTQHAPGLPTQTSDTPLSELSASVAAMAATNADESVVETWQAPGSRGQFPCLPALAVKLFAGFLLGWLLSRI